LKNRSYNNTSHSSTPTPLDTYRGFYRLGYSIILSIVALVIIPANFSYPTLSSYLPDPFFRIYITRIHKESKTKHGSDPGTCDNEGRFIPQKFEDNSTTMQAVINGEYIWERSGTT
jgi:peroxygenase